MSTYTICETRDQALLAEFFKTDYPRYAYLLGDLDPFFFDKSRWWVAQEKSLTKAALLRYGAFSTPVFIGLAENDAQAKLWRDALQNPPSLAHIHYRKQHVQFLTNVGTLDPIGTHYRMIWVPRKEQRDAEEIDLSEVVPLCTSDIEKIRELHASASPGAYFDERLLETGLCCGIWRGETLAAFAGCHVYSKKYSVAALGAIATHPAHRRQEMGTKVSLRLLEALKSHIACICLNVHSDNAAALRIYQRLGFQVHCEYEEALLQTSATTE